MTEKEVLKIIKKAVWDGRTELNLRGKGIRSLPGEIGKLTELTRLDLRENELTSLPAELGKLTKLRRLYLSRNELTSLPAELGKLTELMGFNVFGNPL